MHFPRPMKPIVHAVVLGLAAAACASTPPPTARVSASESSIRAASELGASQTPEAQLHLTMAQDQLAKAKQLIKDGDHEKASWLLSRAQADGELSVALAREAQAKAKASETQAKVREAAPQVAPVDQGAR